jgi:hypothetical protein
MMLQPLREGWGEADKCEYDGNMRLYLLERDVGWNKRKLKSKETGLI